MEKGVNQQNQAKETQTTLEAKISDLRKDNSRATSEKDAKAAENEQ